VTSLWAALLLGVIQGVTEFLPISSSAHLILAPRAFGWRDQGLAFDIAAHLGTLLAVLVYFRRDLAEIAVAGWRRGPRDAEGKGRLAWGLLLGTLPVAVAGLLLQDLIATTARDALLVAATSIAYGSLLGWVDRVASRRRGLEGLGYRAALLIGAAQALALVPGTSRSGITITAALLLGFDRPAAARFSFLLSVPAGFLVLAKDVLDIARGQVPLEALPAMLVGFTAAAISGYLVIAGFLAWLRRGSLMAFAVYRVLLGLLILGFWSGGRLG
jgi:undecaprenyl-diphosphatase